jgi:hypothetical protein
MVCTRGTSRTKKTVKFCSHTFCARENKHKTTHRTAQSTFCPCSLEPSTWRFKDKVFLSVGTLEGRVGRLFACISPLFCQILCNLVLQSERAKQTWTCQSLLFLPCCRIRLLTRFLLQYLYFCINRCAPEKSKYLCTIPLEWRWFKPSATQ